MKVTVSVKPNSKQESVTALDDGTLVVRVNAPPIDGRANERVIELLATHFGRPKSALTLVRGSSAKKKVFEIA